MKLFRLLGANTHLDLQSQGGSPIGPVAAKRDHAQVVREFDEVLEVGVAGYRWSDWITYNSQCCMLSSLIYLAKYKPFLELSYTPFFRP